MRSRRVSAKQLAVIDPTRLECAPRRYFAIISPRHHNRIVSYRYRACMQSARILSVFLFVSQGDTINIANTYCIFAAQMAIAIPAGLRPFTKERPSVGLGRAGLASSVMQERLQSWKAVWTVDPQKRSRPRHELAGVCALALDKLSRGRASCTVTSFIYIRRRQSPLKFNCVPFEHSCTRPIARTPQQKKTAACNPTSSL